MHRERAGTLEPELVAGASKQLEERETVPRGAVAKVRALLERPRPPRQLAARDEEALVLVVAGRDLREASDHPRRSVAPLHTNRAVGWIEVPSEDGGQFARAAVLDGVALEGVARAHVQFFVWLVGQRRDTAGEAVRRAEKQRRRPSKSCVQGLTPPGPRGVVGALLPEVAPTDPSGGEHRAGASPHELTVPIVGVRSDQFGDAALNLL